MNFRMPALVLSLAMAMVNLPQIAAGATIARCGPSVCYEYDSAQAGAALFGNPTLVGDALQFLPANFRAVSLQRRDSRPVTAAFVIDRIYSVSGATLGSIAVSAAGDYRGQGPRGGVSAGLDMLLLNRGTRATAARSSTMNALDACRDLELWSLYASIDPRTAFAGRAGDLALVIRSTLRAFGGDRFIQQKGAFAVSAAAVPIPGAAWLLGPALAGLAGLRRRRCPSIPA